MKRTVLIILDGFGERQSRDGNAIRLADTPRWSGLLQKYPHTLVATSGMAVGLPDGQMGNSEVGHMNLGSGRVVYQDLTRINKAISDGDFFTNPVLSAALDGGEGQRQARAPDRLDQPRRRPQRAQPRLRARRAVSAKRIADVCWHAFLDGRDTPPRSAAATVAEVEANLARLGAGRIASLVGRFYAMDRDNRWDRVQAAYELLVDGRATAPRPRSPASRPLTRAARPTSS